MTLTPKKPSRKRRYPVSSFGPELMAALKKGAVEKVELKFPSMKAAIFFQHRIHTLRSMMREENHPDAELVSRARTARHWDAANDPKGEKGCSLIIQPNDIQFRSIVEAAGVSVEVPLLPLTTEESLALDPHLSPSDPYKDFKGED